MSLLVVCVYKMYITMSIRLCRIGMSQRLCIRKLTRVCVRACVRACVCVGVCIRDCACSCAHASVHACVSKRYKCKLHYYQM